MIPTSQRGVKVSTLDLPVNSEVKSMERPPKTVVDTQIRSILPAAFVTQVSEVNPTKCHRVLCSLDGLGHGERDKRELHRKRAFLSR